EQEERQHEEAAGEDDRHDARLIDAERQELARAAEDAPAANVLGRLRRDAALALGGGDGPDHHGGEQDEQHHQFLEADVVAGPAAQGEDRLFNVATLKEQAAGSGGQAGDDAGHDDEADAVADAVLVDLLADPHQEDGAGRHGQDHGEPVEAGG